MTFEFFVLAPHTEVNSDGRSLTHIRSVSGRPRHKSPRRPQLSPRAEAVSFGQRAKLKDILTKYEEILKMLQRKRPPTEAALLRMSASLFGALRQVDPFPSRSQPRHLFERAYRLSACWRHSSAAGEIWLLRLQTWEAVAQKRDQCKNSKGPARKGAEVGGWYPLRSQSNAEPAMTEGVTGLVHRTGSDVHCVSGCDTICGIKPAMTDPDRHPCPVLERITDLIGHRAPCPKSATRDSCTAAKQHL